MPLLGAILGATGSGKTELAVLLAQKLGAEIICMDSRQVYKGFRIGTAQPTAGELSAVPHHLVDFLPPELQYNAAEFAKDVKNLLSQKPGAKFILVGGTGLYMQALCQGLNPLPPSNPEIRERLKKHYESKEQRELYLDALKADPGIEGKIMQGDTQRLLRVLELNSQLSAPNSQPNRVGGIGSVPSVWLDFPRDELYGRIEQRVIKMLKRGWVEEVAELSKTVPANAPAWQSLGYLELKAALEKNEDPFSVAKEVALKTRRYAKRQITWFKHKENSVYIDGKQAKNKENLERIINHSFQ
ncbi:MAG: tRNA (adenosine(37)-N6)-dimethylallyltransferase MiaA [Candidatus Fibromonas sp.]|jgi:tRNA dimethylallyltransferase|nr:tRNA (adenosine(37)-N6)-dimethylallyltransferase MiaA [Candidatus Fibromonas sp.]